jgi:hypothetical protein
MSQKRHVSGDSSTGRKNTWSKLTASTDHLAGICFIEHVWLLVDFFGMCTMAVSTFSLNDKYSSEVSSSVEEQAVPIQSDPEALVTPRDSLVEPTAELSSEHSSLFADQLNEPETPSKVIPGANTGENSRNDSQTTPDQVESPEETIQRYFTEKINSARYSFKDVNGNYTEISPEKDGFHLVTKVDDASDLALLLSKTGENYDQRANALLVARKLGLPVDDSSSDSAVGDALDSLRASGVVTSDTPRSGAALTASYTTSSGKSHTVYLPLFPIEADKTFIGIQGSASLQDSIGAEVSYSHTTTLKQTPTTKSGLHYRTGVGVTERNGININGDVTLSNDRIKDGYLEFDQFGARASAGTFGVSAGVSYRSGKTNPYNGDQTITAIDAGISPGGPTLGASIDLSEKVEVNIGVNQLPLGNGNSFPVPATAVATLSVKGEPTLWVQDKRGYNIAYTGNEGKPIVNIGGGIVAGIPLGWILPGEGAFPDRVVPYTPQQKETNFISQVHQSRVSSAQKLWASELERGAKLAAVPNSEAKLPDAESAVYMLPTGDWKRAPLTAANFEKTYSVKAIDEQGNALLTRDKALDLVVEKFKKDNPVIASRVKTPQDERALRTYVSYALKYPELLSPDEARKQGVDPSLINPHITSHTIRWDDEYKTLQENGHKVLYLQGAVSISLREEKEQQFKRTKGLPEYSEDTITITFEGRVDDPNNPYALTEANAEKLVRARIQQAIQEAHNQLSDGDFQNVSPERMKELRAIAVKNILENQGGPFSLRVLNAGESKNQRFETFVNQQHELVQKLQTK